MGAIHNDSIFFHKLHGLFSKSRKPSGSGTAASQLIFPIPGKGHHLNLLFGKMDNLFQISSQGCSPFYSPDKYPFSFLYPFLQLRSGICQDCPFRDHFHKRFQIGQMAVCKFYCRSSPNGIRYPDGHTLDSRLKPFLILYGKLSGAV